MIDIRGLLVKYRQLGVVELQQELQTLFEQQFKLKMQHSIGELKSLHQMKNVRRSIARALGVLTEKNAK